MGIAEEAWEVNPTVITQEIRGILLGLEVCFGSINICYPMSIVTGRWGHSQNNIPDTNSLKPVPYTPISLALTFFPCSGFLSCSVLFFFFPWCCPASSWFLPSPSELCVAQPSFPSRSWAVASSWFWEAAYSWLRSSAWILLPTGLHATLPRHKHTPLILSHHAVRLFSVLL